MDDALKHEDKDYICDHFQNACPLIGKKLIRKVEVCVEASDNFTKPLDPGEVVSSEQQVILNLVEQNSKKYNLPHICLENGFSPQ